jgi:hypothetical protein
MEAAISDAVEITRNCGQTASVALTVSVTNIARMAG